MDLALTFLSLMSTLLPVRTMGIFSHTDQVPVPVGHVLVSHTGGHIEHHDGTLSLDIVAIPEPAKLLLACCVPDVESDGSSVGVEHKGVNLDSEGGDVLLLELSS